MSAAALALVLLVASSAQAFVRLNGNSDFYARCEPEGSYCVSNSGCCQGLECAIGSSNLQGMGGICRRRSNGRHEDSSSPNSNYELPSQASFLSRSCSLNSDCPTGQCCNRRPIGFRGSLVASCESDCNYREIGDLLGDYYNRFYRRDARGKSLRQAEKKHSEHHHQQHEEDKQEKKKKKKASN